MADTTKAPATLTTTERGVTRSLWSLVAGDYIWHRGAFRRVTAVSGREVRMGRHVLHARCGDTVEAAP